MIQGLAALLVFQLIGEAIVFGFKLTIPGSVVGLLLLAVALAMVKTRFSRTRVDVETTSTALLGNLGLLFVPAGVGIVENLDLVAKNGVTLMLILLASTVITLAVTVWVFIAMRAFLRRAEEARHDSR
jgi:holin-like protein